MSFSYKLGTGKTRTLVAAIAEIVRGTNDFVLVLAHSNAACDEIAIRLLEVLRIDELFRLYAKSFNKDAMNPRIAPISNLHDGEIQFPSLEYLHQFRVVLATLLTAGSLVRSCGADHDFNSKHFSRIIIDEAGCIHEPAVMIPIAGLYLKTFNSKKVYFQVSHNANIVNILSNTGLCSEYDVVNARIVLAGDPKQLDAVTKSNNAVRLGFKTSWMEYLMDNKKCYMRHPITKRFDPNFITVLTKNYRSHQDILAIPNKLFYDGVLEAKGKIGTYIIYLKNLVKNISTYKLCCLSDETHWIIGNELLPNKNFPLVFESVKGVCENELRGTSCFNTAEVHAVIEWIRKLIRSKGHGKEVRSSDIGVVSPYKKQCSLIRDELRNNGFDGITVGTAEVYQGQERRIIIISTVRTGNELGFVRNEQVNLFKPYQFR